MKAKTDRFTRFVILVWSVAGVILITEAVRALMALGLFAYVTPVTPGVCRTIAIGGPGDLAFDAKSRILFIAASDRRAPGKADGLYYLPLGESAAHKLAGTPQDFHPTAVSIGYDTGGAPTLWVVDRKQNGRVAVESYAIHYDGGAPALSSVTQIEGGLAARAGGVAALGAMRFYLAGDPAKSEFMAWANRYLLVPRADVLYFNGMLFRPSINGLADPSAVALSADARHLFVTSRNERRLSAFCLDPYTGTLRELGSLSLPLRPERMSLDAISIWVAGPPRLPALSGKTAASAVVRVSLGPDGTPQGYETVYADDGQAISAAGAVAKAEKHLFIGSALDDKLLDCPAK